MLAQVCHLGPKFGPNWPIPSLEEELTQFDWPLVSHVLMAGGQPHIGSSDFQPQNRSNLSRTRRPDFRQTHEQTVLSGVRAYVAYSLFCISRGRQRSYSAGAFAIAARVAIRSMCVRTPVAHRAIFGDRAIEALVAPRRRRGSLGLGDALP